MSNTLLPVIDITDLSLENSKKLVDAASKHGFLLLKNHPLDKENIVDKLFDLSKEFFELPLEIKAKNPINVENDGYIAPMVEDLQQDGSGKGDPKEAFNITHFDLSDFKPRQSLPEVFANELPFISSCIEKYYSVLHAVCRMLAIGLEVKDDNGNLNPEFFVDVHGFNLKARSTLRLIHYPKPAENEKDTNQAGAHTDYGSLTFVLQRPHRGLQIHDGSKWVNVEIPEQSNDNLLVVNIADMLSFWTNGYLKSTLHRVRTTEERYSVVFFCQPADTIILEPVNSEIIKTHPGNYYSLKKDGKPLTSLEHLQLRLQQGYKRT